MIRGMPVSTTKQPPECRSLKTDNMEESHNIILSQTQKYNICWMIIFM